jgi:hypothetical protein
MLFPMALNHCQLWSSAICVATRTLQSVVGSAMRGTQRSMNLALAAAHLNLSPATTAADTVSAQSATLSAAAARSDQTTLTVTTASRTEPTRLQPVHNQHGIQTCPAVTPTAHRVSALSVNLRACLTSTCSAQRATHHQRPQTEEFNLQPVSPRHEAVDRRAHCHRSNAAPLPRPKQPASPMSRPDATLGGMKSYRTQPAGHGSANARTCLLLACFSRA